VWHGGGVCALVAAVAALAGAGSGTAGVEPSPLAPQLQAASDEVAAAAAALSGLTPDTPAPTRRAAGDRLAAAGRALRAVVVAYQAGGATASVEEADLLEAASRRLLDARVDFGPLAGESSGTSTTTAKDVTDGLGGFVTSAIVQRMGAEGLLEFLKQTRGDPRRALDRLLANARQAIEAKVRNGLRGAVERELRKRFPKVPIQLGVPLRDQLQSFARQWVTDYLAKLVFRLGPAGIVVELLGGRRLFAGIVRGVENLFRGTGKLPERTRRTIDGYAKHVAALDALGPGCADLAATKRALGAALRAVGATHYLKGDLTARAEGRGAGARAAENLFAQLLAAEERLHAAIREAKARCGIEPALKPKDLAAAIAVIDRVLADLKGLNPRLGPPAVPLPTQANCPAGLVIETFQSLPPYAKTGEVSVVLGRFAEVHTGSYLYHCVYVSPQNAADEWYLLTLGVTPPDLPGTIAAGSCGATPTPGFNGLVRSIQLDSVMRYLSIGGGPRKYYTDVKGGGLALWDQTLVQAEAAGVGVPCPLP
jgi:hypothetical protein